MKVVFPFKSVFAYEYLNLDLDLIKMSLDDSEIDQNNNEKISVKKSTFNGLLIGAAKVALCI